MLKIQCKKYHTIAKGAQLVTGSLQNWGPDDDVAFLLNQQRKKNGKIINNQTKFHAS